MSSALETLLSRAPRNHLVYEGRVKKSIGITVEATGLRGSLGNICEIHSPHDPPLLAEVIGFRDQTTVLLPYSETRGVGPGSRIVTLDRSLAIPAGEGLLGRILDGIGRPIDGKGPLPVDEVLRLDFPPINPLERLPINEALHLGIASLDGLLTMGLGQRMGIFAGSGLGKSTLLGQIARTSSAKINVIALIGERGREVNEFLEKSLGPEGLARSVVVVATSDSPPLQRYKGSFVAVALAECFRRRGFHVLFMMDSVTRFAGVLREIGLALGEPPTTRGYPPSFYSTLPLIVERLGRFREGSISGIFSVLVEGDDLNDPVADTMRALLDGHIVLSRDLATLCHFPAVDILESTSRLMPHLIPEDHLQGAVRVREALSIYREIRDLLSIGAYKKGQDPLWDWAISRQEILGKFLRQGRDEYRSFGETQNWLVKFLKDNPP